MSSSTDVTRFEGWSLDSGSPPREFGEMLPEWAQPLLTTPKAWENYSDDLVYEADKRLRKWAGAMSSRWRRGNGSNRRYQFTDLCRILGIDGQVSKGRSYNAVSRVFAYYSSKVMKETTIDGVRKKKVYCISPARLKKQPYSLRLRLEELAGEKGTWQQFRLPKDDLEVGHARNPRTERNIELRKERHREAFNEYQRKRREESGR